mgnify:CR=1 FL=1
MFLRRIPRHLFASLLVAALLLQSLMPAFAGMRSEQGARWIEVCVNSGIKWVKLDAGKADLPSHAADAHADHCVLCAATGPVPEFDALRFLPVQPVAAVTLPSVAVPVSAFPGHALRSRAPPAFS